MKIIKIGTDSKITLYISFVRSHLEYANEVWAPQTTISDIRIIKCPASCHARYISNISCKVSESHMARLTSLRLSLSSIAIHRTE